MEDSWSQLLHLTDNNSNKNRVRSISKSSSDSHHEIPPSNHRSIENYFVPQVNSSTFSLSSVTESALSSLSEIDRLSSAPFENPSSKNNRNKHSNIFTSNESVPFYNTSSSKNIRNTHSNIFTSNESAPFNNTSSFKRNLKVEYLNDSYGTLRSLSDSFLTLRSILNPSCSSARALYVSKLILDPPIHMKGSSFEILLETLGESSSQSVSSFKSIACPKCLKQYSNSFLFGISPKVCSLCLSIYCTSCVVYSLVEWLKYYNNDPRFSSFYFCIDCFQNMKKWSFHYYLSKEISNPLNRLCIRISDLHKKIDALLPQFNGLVKTLISVSYSNDLIDHISSDTIKIQRSSIRDVGELGQIMIKLQKWKWPEDTTSILHSFGQNVTKWIVKYYTEKGIEVRNINKYMINSK